MYQTHVNWCCEIKFQNLRPVSYLLDTKPNSWPSSHISNWLSSHGFLFNQQSLTYSANKVLTFHVLQKKKIFNYADCTDSDTLSVIKKMRSTILIPTQQNAVLHVKQSVSSRILYKKQTSSTNPGQPQLPTPHTTPTTIPCPLEKQNNKKNKKRRRKRKEKDKKSVSVPPQWFKLWSVWAETVCVSCLPGKAVRE